MPVLPSSGEPATIDERAIEIPLAEKGASPQEVALVLSEAKALNVGLEFPEAIVIGPIKPCHFAKGCITSLATRQMRATTFFRFQVKPIN